MTQLLEETYGQPTKIDAESGVIQGVKVLGRVSQNNREYSDRAMSEAAKMYEGLEVNIDHDRQNPNRERKLIEGFGVLRNVSQKADGVYADLHYLKAHPSASLFMERAQRFPDKVGLSHNAEGTLRTKGGKTIVESIRRVNSVDVVTRPATNKSLFESEQTKMTKPLKAVLESVYGAEKVTACKLLEMDGMGEMAVETAGEGMSADDQAKSAFKAMVAAVLDDDSLDVAGKSAKIKQILQAQEKLMASDKKPEGSGSGDSGGDTESTSESVDLKAIRAKLDRMEKREKAESLLESAGLPFDKTLVESLALLPDEAAMKKLVDREKAHATESSDSKTTRSKAKPIMESASGGGSKVEYPKTVKEFASLVSR